MSERQAKLGDGDISPEQHAPSVAQDPGPDPVKPGSGLMCFLRVFTYNDTLGWLLIAVAVVCMVGAGATLPLMEIVFGRFVNVFNDFTAGRTSPQAYRDQIGHFTLYFIYLFVAKLLLTYIWTVLISMAAIRTTRRLRVDFLRQALRQEISFFDSSSTESSSSSSVVAGRITTNGDLIHDGISEKLGVIVQAASCFVAALIVALAVQWKLTLIVVSVVPLNIVVSMVCIAFDAVYEQRILDVYAGGSSLAHEAFSSVRTVHAFWAFPRLRRRFDDVLERARGIGRRKSLVYAVLFPTESLCVFAGYAIAFWRGIAMYADGEIASPGTVVTVVFAVMVAAQALIPVVPHIIAVAKAAAAAKDLFAVIDRRSAIDSLSEAGDVVAGFQGDIKLRGVCFAYSSRPRLAVLSGLDLDLPAGKTTALVGASGSGKSTVFGLLERWYDAASGSITLDGRPIQSLNLQWLRTNIRLVQQEPVLFSGSIFQNVADGLAGTDRADLSELETRGLVREACEAAYAHDFIQELPDGYDTRIGERGASLSGGQRQRIVIARSIISNPKVLLLDEATSALDPVAEEVVQRALNNVARGRTMVIIAHRLSTVRDADNVAVLSGGQVVEQGTHHELMALGGAYSSLVKAQDLGDASHEAEASDHDIRDKEAAQVHLVPTCPDTAPSIRETPDEDSHGLLYGLYLILKEQPSLWPHVSLLALACIISGGTYPALAILFSKTMETFDTVNVQRADFFAFLFFVVALANAVSYAVAGWLCNVVGQTIAKYYRSDIFNSTIRQDMAFFDKTDNSSGSLVSRLSSEPTSLQELLSINLPTMLINTVSVVSSCVLAICYGWKLGLALSAGALVVLVGAGYLRVRLEYRLSSESASRIAQSSGMASEAAAAMRTVSSLALERAVVKRYDETLGGIARRAVAVLGRKMLLYALSQSASFLVYALGFWYGGRLVSTGEYSTAQFYVVFIATIFSGESAAVFFQYTTSIAKARTAINYVFKLRGGLKDYEDEDVDRDHDQGHDQGHRQDCLQQDHHQRHHETDQQGKGEAGEAEAGGTSLALDQVTFAYPLQPSIKVLRDIALSIKPGQTMALVGASGCGKSTVVSLLERFYDVLHGEIRADGTDITTLNRRRYRASVALVQQEPVLFQGSIRDNIALGIVTEDAEDDDGTLRDDDIISACIQANIWTFVSSLPDGLSTPCGSQGLSLSGGQRQRIAIARALVRNPDLLLLDEATSALDSASEAAVKEALDRAAAAAGRTTVAIAHRLSTVRDADAIAVLAGGRVVEMGTHQELVARRGVYHSMVLGQALNGSPDG